MKTIGYEDVWELAEEISAKFKSSHKELYCVTTYGRREIIKPLLEALITLGHPIGLVLELEDYEVTHYDKEYVLSLDEEGLSVSKMWHEDNEYHPAGYLCSGGDACYIHSDCSSNMVSHIESDKMIEFALYEYGDDKYDDCNEDCECDCKCCYEDTCECGECPDNDNKKIHIQVSTTVGNDRVGWVPIKIEMSGNEFDTLMDEVFDFWHMPFMF